MKNSNSKILAIVPRKVLKARHKSGVGTYINGLESLGIADFVTESESSDFSKSLFTKYAQFETIDYQIVADLQNSILKALTFPYKAIICSTYEACAACIGLGLTHIMPVYYRTHNSHVVCGTEGQGYAKIHSLLLSAAFNNLKILANCQNTLDSLRERYGVSGQVALNHVTFEQVKSVKKEGLLYISRFDEVKQPKLFASIAQKLNIKARVLTNSIQAAKSWTKLLDEYEVEHDIKYALTGSEKWKFITSAKYAISTSRVESFGLGILETLPYCPTFIIKSDYDWYKNFDYFDCSNLKVISVKEIDQILKSKTKVDSDTVISSIQKATKKSWYDFVENVKFECKESKKSELVKQFETGCVEWSEQIVLHRTLKALHSIIAYNDVKFDSKGNIWKK